MDWIDRVLTEGRKRIDEVEVFYAEGISVSADLKRRNVNIATRSDECSLAIRTIHAGKIGSSGTSDPSRWEECLDAAIASGRLATPQPWGRLPESPTESRPETLCFDPSLVVEPASAVSLMDAMLAGAADHPAEVTGGSVTLSSSTVTVANSRGLERTSRHTGVSVSLEAIAGQSTGSEFGQSCFLDLDPSSVGEQAAFLAARSVDGRDIRTGEYDVLLSPVAYAELLGAAFVPALSGRNVHAGRSWLAPRLNEEVVDTRLSFFDDPARVNGLGSANWDAEGVPTRRIDFIAGGVLRSFAYDLRTAYRYGKESTGSAIRSGASGGTGIGHHNLVVDGPRSDVSRERVVYIHSVVGAHTANPMSGDFSVETANAFWMENGEYAEPIRSAMLVGNVFTMHRRFAGLSREVRQIGALVLPSIRLNGMRLIGK